MKLLIMFSLFVICSCTAIQKLSVTPSSPETSENQTIPDKTPHDKLLAMAISSECAQTEHGNQGKPPASFIKGITLTYVRAICHQDQDWVKIASRPAGDPATDAIAHYGLAPGPARLESTFALMVGSAARESSWRWCVGKDPGASNTSAETCEAGLYQTSWNSRTASAVLPALFKKAMASDGECFSKEYKGTTTCSEENLKNWGEGDGVEFQMLSKNCPGFATEYHAVMLRVRRSHYGPINLKKAEMKPQCVAMFTSIRKAVEADQSLCGI